MLQKLKYLYFKLLNSIIPYSEIKSINREILKLKNIYIEDFLTRNLYTNAKYLNEENCLNNFEYQVFSQNGEDGIIEEIFKRIKTTNRFFVEFGVETGVQNNTTYLLHKTWEGLWIDGSKKYVKKIKKNFKKTIEKGKLRIENSFVTSDNIEDIFNRNKVPVEFDLLSIDIDKNDYHIWNAINKFKPRVVVIEYNSIFPPHVEWVVEYDPYFPGGFSSNFGASLKSYELLGRQKGYSLVACNFMGVNAFFVRNDLINDTFLTPFTSEKHYEGPKYNLLKTEGHVRKLDL